MKLLVTAFGPFAGRQENASSLALHELKKAFPKISTRILPVDSFIFLSLRTTPRSTPPTRWAMSSV